MKTAQETAQDQKGRQQDENRNRNEDDRGSDHSQHDSDRRVDAVAKSVSEIMAKPGRSCRYHLSRRLQRDRYCREARFVVEKTSAAFESFNLCPDFCKLALNLE